MVTRLLLLIVASMLTSCDSADLPPPPPPRPPMVQPDLSFDFRDGEQGWQAGFADYPPGEEGFYELESGLRDLPPGADPTGQGYYIAGNNHSDDLFMFVKRKIGGQEGVRANTLYRLKFTIILASDAPTGCSGVGGSPGESVALKAGASSIEPMAVVEVGIYRMNADKGEQSMGGPAGSVVGDIANGIPCEEALEEGQPYASLQKEHTSEFSVRSSSEGELWLLVGTDSGFEGLTALYYQSIKVELSEEGL